MFSTGRLTCVGTRSEREGRLAIDKTISELGSFFSTKPTYGEIRTKNLVALGRVRRLIDIPRVVATMEPTSYNPESFPGAIYKASVHTSLTIHRAGKVIFTGARSEAEARSGISNLFQQLERRVA